MFDRSLQVIVVPVLFQLWQERLQCRLRIPHKTVVDLCASAELFSTKVNLDDGRILGKELLVRKVRPNHHQKVAIHHRVIAGRKSEQTGHAHVERVVVLNELFPAHRMHDRGVELARHFDQLRMRSGAACSAKDRDLLRLIENLRQRRDFVIGRTHLWFRLGKMETGPLFNGVAQGDISGQGNDRHAAPRERRLHRNLQHARHLLGLRNQLTVMAALREEMFRVGFLKIAAADFVAGNLRRNGENRNTVALAVVETIDQMQVAGTATAGADRQSSGEMRFRAGGKRRGFLMS